MFMKVESQTSVKASYQGTNWDENDPSVFRMNIINMLDGEYQLTNGYGPTKAPQVLRVRNPISIFLL
jgi:hypothetical protein